MQPLRRDYANQPFFFFFSREGEREQFNGAGKRASEKGRILLSCQGQAPFLSYYPFNALPNFLPDISCVSSRLKFIEGLDTLSVPSFSPVFSWLGIVHSSSSAFKSTSAPLQENLWYFQRISGGFSQSTLAVFLGKTASCISSSLPRLQ